MKRQRNMAQMKKQIKTPERELNKREIRDLSDAVFKTLVIRMLKELIQYGNGIKKTQEGIKLTLNEIKKNLQLQLNNNKKIKNMFTHTHKTSTSSNKI